MNQHMIHLRRIAIHFQPDIVQYVHLGIVTEIATQIKRHLFFSRVTRRLLPVTGFGKSLFFQDHG
ncbi:hypothetical protein D3C78_1615500 [compost metagenome]